MAFRRVLKLLASGYLLVTFVPVWLVGGFICLAATAVVFESRGKGWVPALIVLVAIDLAWLASLVSGVVMVRRRRAARGLESEPRQ